MGIQIAQHKISTAGWLNLLLISCFISPAVMVMECMCEQKQQIHSLLYLIFFSAGKEIDCFECNSWEDERCHDPFNFTSFAGDMPSVVQCDGCCVKLVSRRGSGRHLSY